MDATFSEPITFLTVFSRIFSLMVNGKFPTNIVLLSSLFRKVLGPCKRLAKRLPLPLALVVLAIPSSVFIASESSLSFSTSEALNEAFFLLILFFSKFSVVLSSSGIRAVSSFPGRTFRLASKWSRKIRKTRTIPGTMESQLSSVSYSGTLPASLWKLSR